MEIKISIDKETEIKIAEIINAMTKEWNQKFPLSTENIAFTALKIGLGELEKIFLAE